jgi:nucleotide-binding universal stress UspA family protein
MEKVTRSAAAAFRDIVVPMVSTKHDEPALAVAEGIALQNEGHVTALLVSSLPDTAYALDASVSPMVWSDIIARMHADAEAERTKLAERLRRLSVPYELRSIETETYAASQLAAVHCRHGDLTVLVRPSEGNGHRGLIEAALFNSGRPVLIVPPKVRAPLTIKTVLVAWNASKEAARALADADSFIMGAETVKILTVDAQPTFLGHGQSPGADISAHLARRGASVDLLNIASGGRSDGEAILDEAIVQGADLIVMGGYGHTRAREFIFGGVTKHLLNVAETPLFMSH